MADNFLIRHNSVVASLRWGRMMIGYTRKYICTVWHRQNSLNITAVTFQLNQLKSLWKRICSETCNNDFAATKTFSEWWWRHFGFWQDCACLYLSSQLCTVLFYPHLRSFWVRWHWYNIRSRRYSVKKFAASTFFFFYLFTFRRTKKKWKDRLLLSSRQK